MNRIFLSCLFVMLFAAAVFAAVPTTINQQGYLTNAAGLPVDGQVNMVFKLYKADNSEVWSETQNNVTVSKGVYSVILGSVTTLSTLPFDEQYFLGIKVGSDPEMSPRIALTSVAYAMKAKDADSLDGMHASDFVPNRLNRPVFRYAVWSTYDQGQGWFGNSVNSNGNPSLFGGIYPQSWTDGNACASSLSSNKNDLLTLFNKKMYSGTNANVWAQSWYSYSSTTSVKAGALFRIRNNTTGAITWNVATYQTAWVDEDRASITINGENTWCPGSSYFAGTSQSVALSIPPSRTSTIIFIAGSSPPLSSLRACFLAFFNNSLALPAGLEFVDDLDIAADGWSN